MILNDKVVMLTSSPTNGLAAYFQKSDRFYYAIIDIRGSFVYVNPLFQQEFGHITSQFQHQKIAIFFPDSTADKFKQIIQQCVLHPETLFHTDTSLQSRDGFTKIIRWEISAFFNEGATENIQIIGYKVEEPGHVIPSLGHRVGELAERYKAYEQSAEGIWMCETKEPVSVLAKPEEILSFWRANAYLAECNDKMARMYGFNNAQELVGTPLSSFIDFDDPVWIDYLQSFIENGFKSTGVETKEFDRYGNILFFLNSMEGVVENKMLKRIWGTQQNITEQKKSVEQINHLARLVDTVSDIIISRGTDLNIISWNKAAENIYGYKAKEVIGKKITDILEFEFQGISKPRFFEILNEKGEWRGEVYARTKSGNVVTILAAVTKILNEKGETTGYVSVGKDVTEKRKMEEQLRQSELFYRNLFANSLDGVLLTNEKGVITFASPSITPILGYSTDEVIGKSTFDFAHPEDRAVALSAFTNELEDDVKHKFISVRLLKKSGDWMWCIVRGHNLIQNQYVKGFVVYFYDDTMRKETEAALIASELRFRYQATVLKNVTDVIVTTDMNRVITSWNNVLERLTGISESEATGKPFRDVISTNYSPYTNEQVADIVFKEGIWRGEISFKGRDGEQVYLLHTISILHNDAGSPIGLLGVGKDITKRKRAEARLQESEYFFRNMSYYSLDGVVMADVTGKIIYSGPSVYKISGYESDQLLSHNFFDFVHPDDIPAAVDAFVKEVNKQSVLNYIYLRLKHATDGWTWCTVRGHNLLDTPGFNSIVIYFTNDTKRKQAEDKLRKSEENFRNLIYNLKQGVILQDRNGVMTICNQAALDMLGLTEDQLLGKTSLDPSWNVIHEDGSDFPGQTHPVPTVLQTKQPVKDVIMGVYRPLTKDRVWLLVNAEPVFANDGEIINVVCSFTDITEQKRLSKELVEQEVQKNKLITQATIDGQEKERLEIGKELHDNINQHLTTTRLYMEVAREKASGEVLDLINQSHKTLAGIINQIRLLSQSLVPPTLGDLGLVESIHELCDSLKRAHKFNIDFFFRHFSEETMPENLKLMLFRITQEQVNNIIRHAEADSIQIKLQSDAEYIILSISDNGKGFDLTNYKKGLGFSNITNRAGLFNGKVEIDATPGKGCSLTVVVPLTNY